MKHDAHFQRVRSFVPRQVVMTLLAPTLVCAQLPPPPVSPAPVVKLEYDAQGNSKRSIVAPGVADFTTSHDYDRLHRRFKTTDARGKPTLLDYNGREDLLRVTDPRNLVTQYPRNGLGDTTGLVSPDTGTAVETRDAAGNLLTRLDSRGVLASHAYDALNRLTRITYTQGGQPSQALSWTYDETGPGFSNGVGRLTSTQYAGGSTRHAYDAQGRLTSTTQFSEGEAFLRLTTSFGYDAGGRMVSITYPSGRILSIPHSGGLPTSLSLASGPGATAVPLVSEIQYEPFGAARAWRWHFTGGPQWHERVFDASGRMVRYPLGGALRDIRYDDADRIASYTHLDRFTGLSSVATAALNQNFAYDALGRLTQVSSSVGNWTYSYDDNGNRTAVLTSVPGAATTARNHLVSPTSNRLLGLDNPARTLSHDAAGNTWADQQGSVGWTAVYDLSGRLARIRSSRDGNQFNTIAYGYNAFGQRVLKQPLSFEVCSGTLTPCKTFPVYTGGVVYLHSPEGQLLGEYNAQTGAPVREYLWLHDMPMAVVAYDAATASDPAPVFYIQADHLNTPRVVLDRNGAQRWSWVAEPFGNSSPNVNPVGLGEFTLNLRMPGQYFDVETGLAQNWHREYDAGVGRYTQSDPIGLAGGLNTYSYVESNPLSYVDPLGLDRWGDTMCLPTHVYIVESTGSGKFGEMKWGAAGAVVNGSSESPAFMTFPANSFPDANQVSPGIADGTFYGTYAGTAHGYRGGTVRGPGVVLNKDKAIPTLGPNPIQGGLPLATYIHMHCQNYEQRRNDTNRGSQGCVTVRGDFCQRLWKLLENQCNKNVIVHLIRN